MATKQEDRARNPNGGEVALSNFSFPPEVAERMLLTPENYITIGQITVHWGQVEADVTSALFLMKGFNGNEDEAAKLDEKPLEQRLSQLKTALETGGHKEPLEILKELSDKVERLKWKRDVIAHGALLFDEHAKPSFYLQSRKIELPISEIKEFEPTSADLRELARRIYTWTMTHRGDRRGTPLNWLLGNFSTSTTLRSGGDDE